MTREEWIERYVARVLQNGTWMAEAQVIASAENGADATEQMGITNPDDWEDPESLADEDFSSEGDGA